MASLTNRLVAVFGLLITFSYSQAQNSVGIGTNSPNSNAVLELVSPGSNQGFLVPRLTTSQRTDASFISNLSAADNGLLVFDSDENQFYFWNASDWASIGNGTSLVAGLGLEIVGNTINNLGDSDADPANEIQDLGNVLTQGNDAGGSVITNVGNPVDAQDVATKDYVDGIVVTSFSLSDILLTSNDAGGAVLVNLADPTNAQDAATKNYVDNLDVSDADADPSNEIQNLTDVLGEGNDAGAGLISNLADPVSAQDAATKNYVDNINTNDADANPSNEIQNLSISGNSVNIDGGGTGFDITPTSPSLNQVLKWDGSQWVAGSDDTGVGTLPALGDAQIITNNGSNIGVTVSGDAGMDNTGAFTIQPDAIGSTEIIDGTISNADISGSADIASSKLQSNVVLNGENVSQLANDAGYLTSVADGNITSVAPSKLTQEGASNGEVLKWNNGAGNWEPATDNVNDADNNPTNEIQVASAVPVSPSGNLTSTDVQNALEELQGDIDTDSDSDPSNEIQDISLAGNTLSITGSAPTVNLVGYLDNTDNQNASAVPVSPSGNLTSTDVQNALEELQGDIDTDMDSNPSNEIQSISLAANVLSISGSAPTVNLAGYLDNTDNQNASAVPVTPSGNLTSTNTQSALVELQGDIDADTDSDPTNEHNTGGSFLTNNVVRITDNGGNTDIDISTLTGNLNAGSNRINNLTDPAVAQDAATKGYVDNQVFTTTWGLNGNNGTTPGADFVGTRDATDLVLATNGLQGLRLYNSDNSVGIGPLAAGLNPGLNPSDRFLTISSDANGPSTSGLASIELSGYASNLTDEIGRLDFDTRISGSDNLVARISAARAGDPAAGELRFGTHNATTFTNHMVIDENGDVGIGVTNPGTQLDINGTTRMTGFILSTSPTNGYVLTSNAAGVGTWQPPAAGFTTNNTIPRGDGSGLVSSILTDNGTGRLGINNASPDAGLHLVSNDGSVFTGAFGSGAIPATGSSARMMWYPRKAAFRAGRATTADWNDANIANYSVALGFNGIASGEAAVSIGYDNDVAAFRSVGIGTSNVVNQQQSFAAGVGNQINGLESFTLGLNNVVGAPYSGAIGWDVETGSQDSALVIGAWAEATGRASYVIGNGEGPTVKLVNNINNSIMMGMGSSNPTLFMNRGQFGQSGDVGIGTTNPQQKLDVAGMIKISTDFTSAVGGSMRFTGSDFEGYDGSAWQSLTMGTWDLNGIDAYYDAGQVGVGTNDPNASYQMEIEVPTASSRPYGLYIDNTFDGGISYGQWINMDNDGTSSSYGLIVNSAGATSGVEYGVYTFGEARNYFQGSVGIGDLNPSEALEVNGNIVGESLRDYTDPSANYLSWDPGGEFRIVGGTSNTFFYGQTDGKVRIGTQFNSGSSRLLVQGFNTGTDEGFRVQNSLGTLNFVALNNGRVGIRRTPTTYNLEIQGDAGKTTGGSDWVIISDRRLKKNVSDFSDGLDKLVQIEPVRFQYNDLAPTKDKEREYVGVLAQDMQDLFPYMVREMNEVRIDENGKEFNVLNYDNSAMTFILINSVKELNSKVESLESENDELRELLKTQSDQVEALLAALRAENKVTVDSKPKE